MKRKHGTFQAKDKDQNQKTLKLQAQQTDEVDSTSHTNEHLSAKLVNQNVDSASALPSTSKNSEMSSVSLASTITLYDMGDSDLDNNSKQKSVTEAFKEINSFSGKF
jgi:hypothetical protein